MRRVIAGLATMFALSAPLMVSAADHSGHGGHGSESGSTIVHEEVVDGVKATFEIQTMAAAMKEMGMEMPKGVKATHHVSVAFKDAKSGKELLDGTVAVKVQNPDKSFQSKDLSGMHGHFGADFEFSKSGKYGVMCKFVLKDGKTRQAKFWYSVK